MKENNYKTAEKESQKDKLTHFHRATTPHRGGGLKQGRFVILRFSFAVFGGPKYPNAGKNSTKSVIVIPPFVFQVLLKTRT